MRESKIFNYYAFGFNHSVLLAGMNGSPVHNAVDGLVPTLNLYFARLEELDLRVTLQAAEDLATLLEEVTVLPPDSVVDGPLAERIRNAAAKIDTTLDAELNLTTAFIATPKRFGLAHLLNSPASLLGNGVYSSLPAFQQFDFSEAARCIAFERPTAAAFHLMRCLEGQLRDLYCTIVLRGRAKRFMWFEMQAHLARRKDAPPKPLMDHLSNIRENFRNPTQHPDARYNMDEVQDLLAVSIDAINRMSRERAKRGRP